MTTTEFKSFVESIKPNQHGCKIWNGTKRKGYGKLTINGKLQSAHRASFSLFNGPIPKTFVVCHKCDCPACINPEHLFIGTHSENMLDMSQKGRGRNSKPEQYLPVLKPLGEAREDQSVYPHSTRLVHMGKSVRIVWNNMGGWSGHFDEKNILNPWTWSVFKHFRNCLKVTKFYIKHGFYPGKKPTQWKKLNNISCPI